MVSLRVDAALATDVGKKRSENQDAGLIPSVPSASALAQNGRIFVVADGMGGHAGGQQASHLAVSVFADAYYRSDSDAAAALQAAAQAANTSIRKAAAENSELDNMGSTVVAAAYRAGDLAIGHAGDSRAYLLHSGALQLLTRDHSFVAELVAAGRITSEEARRHPQRNVVTRSLGIADTVDLEIDHVKLADGDVLLLCSDGLWDQVRDEKIAQVLQSEAPSRAVRTLVRLANDNGGTDNITALVVRFGGRASTLRRLVKALALVVIILAPLLVVMGAAVLFAMR